jgi:Transposase DDE domain
VEGPGSAGRDQVVEWHRSKHDKIAPGTEEVPVKGRLIFVRVAREGRFVNLWLFTTLMDQEAFPISRLVELYGWRWQAEVDFRYLKTALDMQQLDVKSPEMARKEFYAGLIAYDLVRVVMAGAGESKENQPRSPLSFSQVRRVLLSWLNDWAKDWRSRQGSLSKKIEQLIAQAALQALPNRKKPRPSEPRRARRRSAKFPPLIGSRAAARNKLTLPD